MTPLGVMHIGLLLGAYVIYAFVTFRSFSRRIPYRLLTAANLMYAAGFFMGMLWAKDAWGFYISADAKIMLSAAVFVPYLFEDIARKNTYHLPLLGVGLIAANYVIPPLLASIHLH